MLNQPTLDKLATLHLHGMAEAFRTQADPSQRDGLASLSFEERFGLCWSIRSGRGGRTAPWRAASSRPNSAIAPRSRTSTSACPAASTARGFAP